MEPPSASQLRSYSREERDEKYTVAQTLLDFATEFKNFGDESMRRIFILNRAQAYKWADDDKKARSILAAEDWRASSDKFRIGVAVLLDDFEQAAKIMKHIGAEGSPDKADYKDWPIFKHFRQSKQFAGRTRRFLENLGWKSQEMRM